MSDSKKPTSEPIAYFTPKSSTDPDLPPSSNRNLIIVTVIEMAAFFGLLALVIYLLMRDSDQISSDERLIANYKSAINNFTESAKLMELQIESNKKVIAQATELIETVDGKLVNVTKLLDSKQVEYTQKAGKFESTLIGSEFLGAGLISLGIALTADARARQLNVPVLDQNITLLKKDSAEQHAKTHVLGTTFLYYGYFIKMNFSITEKLLYNSTVDGLSKEKINSKDKESEGT